MELKILTQEEKTQYRGAILALLEESDEDFLTPLSRRRSTKDQTFSGEAAAGAGVLSYYEAMSRQEILVAVNDGEMAGFVSFYENFEGGEAPNIYVSTLVVAKAARGRGLTAKMYDHLFNTLFSSRLYFNFLFSRNHLFTFVKPSLQVLFSPFYRSKCKLPILYTFRCAKIPCSLTEFRKMSISCCCNVTIS